MVTLQTTHDQKMQMVTPQAQDVERAVLGAMMLDRDAISKVVEILDESAFYSSKHQKIYQAIVRLDEQGDAPPDLLTVTEELKRANQLESIGSTMYLTECTESVVSTANVQHHAGILLEKAILRKLIQVCNHIIGESYDPRDQAFTILDRAEQAILKIAETRKKGDVEGIRDIMHKTFTVIDDLHKHRGYTGVRTGYNDLDEMTSGLQRGDLIILAARPSTGKTAFALNIARNAAVNDDVPVGIFSLEMSNISLGMRLLGSESQVDSHRLLTGKIPDNDWVKLSTSVGKLSEAPIYIDDSANLGIMELRAKARRMTNEQKVGLIVVDYLQLVAGPPNIESRVQEISAISRNLKALAKELDIPVVALSQLSRAVEMRTDRRPMLSDLRESGALEQDADVVMFLHPHQQLDDEGIEAAAPEIDLIVAKQRNGPTGTVKLIFRRHITKFESKSFIDYGEEVPF